VRPSPLIAPPPQVTRRYDRGFDWTYGLATPEAAPGPDATLIPVEWDGLLLNQGDTGTGLTVIVENVTGWLDGPPTDGHDAVRAVADGSAWGPKTLGARVIVITGVATGPRDQLGAFRDQLAMRAVAKLPADLTIVDGGDGRSLTALVRHDTDYLRQTWVTPTCYRYQATLTAADPVLFDTDWHTVQINPALAGSTGRVYQRTFSWQYASPYLPNSALLENDGNVAAPVFLLYDGDLAAPEVTDDYGGHITLVDLAAGEQVQVRSDTLVAVAPGGVSRASYVKPGSTPMLLPPATTSRWHLYTSTSGAGVITLAWRSAWA
jgi:hypothetical protein